MTDDHTGSTEIPDDRPHAVVGDKLKGRVALVTGGTRGIGAAISRSLASQGATVAAGYGSGHERATQFQEEFAREFAVQADGATVSLHSGNIGEADDCRRVVREVLDQHGRLDILVNNAGITIDRTVAKMGDEDWLKVLAVNLSGAFFLSQAAMAHMVERGTGRIIMVSSVIGDTGNIGQANYAASKSGLFGLTKTLAKEAAYHLGKADQLTDDGVGVTVNAVTPGFIATEMVEAMPEKVLEGIKKQVPLRRLGRAEEVARIVHFLAADASSYVTGQVWGVNGGLDM